MDIVMSDPIEFPQFRKLSTEVRCLIWRLVPDARVLEVERYSELDPWFTPYESRDPASALLSVNKESRSEYLRYWKPFLPCRLSALPNPYLLNPNKPVLPLTSYFNPDLDVLYIGHGWQWTDYRTGVYTGTGGGNLKDLGDHPLLAGLNTLVINHFDGSFIKQALLEAFQSLKYVYIGQGEPPGARKRPGVITLTQFTYDPQRPVPTARQPVRSLYPLGPCPLVQPVKSQADIRKEGAEGDNQDLAVGVYVKERIVRTLGADTREVAVNRVAIGRK